MPWVIFCSAADRPDRMTGAGAVALTCRGDPL